METGWSNEIFAQNRNQSTTGEYGTRNWSQAISNSSVSNDRGFASVVDPLFRHGESRVRNSVSVKLVTLLVGGEQFSGHKLIGLSLSSNLYDRLRLMYICMSRIIITIILDSLDIPIINYFGVSPRVLLWMHSSSHRTATVVPKENSFLPMQ